MFPLEIDHFPTSSDEFTKALSAALTKVFTPASAAAPAVLTGADWKSADRLRIDLDGASVRPEARPQKPGEAVTRQPGFATRRLEVSGNPLRYQQAKALFSLAASNVAFDFGKDAAGKVLAILTAASDGTVEASITKADLEALLLAGAKPAAAAQGASVERIEISLNSTGPRSVTVEARVSARKMFPVVVRLAGRIDIDEALVATVSGLSATGEGMAGKMVIGFVQPMLAKYNGHTIPLMSFSLGDLRLRDLKMATADGLQVKAMFGS